MSKSRCGVVATVTDGRFHKLEPDLEHPNACICIKGTAAPEMVYAPERLRYPMKRTRPKGDPDPGWERISWDEALQLAATRLLAIKARHGAEAVVFGRPAPGGSAANDYVNWLARLANAFGSPNLMATTHICNWHKDHASRYTYGAGIPAPDFEHANTILLWGHNPHASWPAHARRISAARRRGARLIVIDPRRAGAAAQADLWLRVRPGADGALALAMIHVLLAEGLYDAAFVRDWTNGSFLVRRDTGQLLCPGDVTGSAGGGAAGAGHVVWDTARGRPVAYASDQGPPGSGGRQAQGSDGRGEVKPALFGTYTVTLAGGSAVACSPALELLRDLAAAYAPERSAAITWVPAATVREAARLFARAKPSCYYTYVGLEEHTNATQTNRAICLFFALTGQFDTRGSNLIFPKAAVNAINGRELLPKEVRARCLGHAERPLGPAGTSGNVPAYAVYRAILTGEPYPVKGLVLFGGNPLLSNGDTLAGKAALAALDFYVHMDMFMNPSADLADLLLPACTPWECEAVKASFEMGEATSTWVQLRTPVVQPVHESRSDLAVIFELAGRLGVGHHFWDGDLDAAFNHHLAPSGITVAQLRRHPAGVRVQRPVRERKYAGVDPATGRARGFATPSGRIEVYATPFAQHGYDPLPAYREPAMSPYSRPDLAADYPLVLTMFKLVHFCHTQHRQIPALRRQVPDPYVEIHPDTAAAAGITAGAWVILETPRGQTRLKARLNPSLDPRVVATQHGWWQGCAALGLPGYDPFGPTGANVNLAIGNDALDPISGSVPHRSYLCRVRPDTGGGSGT